MARLRLALGCALLLICTSSNATLLFSEYIEGSSYNKALEIYNSGDIVDFSLQNYVIDIYTNGATSPRYSIELTGLLGTEQVFVVSHSRADQAVTSAADMLSGNLSFNGDDAITLSLNGVVVDRIGQLGVDPGSEWGSGLTSTQDNVLRRNPDVIIGETDPLLDFDPAQYWQGFAIDDFSGLGTHTVSMPSFEDPEMGNVSVPLPGSSALIIAGLLPLLLNGFFSGRRQSFFKQQLA